MSPHAVAPGDGDMQDWSTTTNSNGHTSNRHTNGLYAPPSLARFDDDEVHDLVCVGFGPASLAIAVALNDALEDGVPAFRTDQPKVRFLEKQPAFAWHAGMLLPGAKMQITFMKDMATLRNPRSRFTFINYLHEKKRLVQFTNLGTFLPQRLEYEDYLKWCAGHFEDVVDYGREVLDVGAGHVDAETGAVEYFSVRSKNQKTGRETILRARHVVIAAGGRPNIPPCLPADHPMIIHSSQYATSIDQRFPPGKHPRSVIVVGAGQSAAEVFTNIPSRFPSAKAHLVFRASALRPSDDSPFVNEVFNPSRVDDVYAQDPELRAEELRRDRATNYAVVRLELIEHIYNTLYSNRIQYGDDEARWPQRTYNHREIVGISDTEVDGKPAVNLHIKNHSSNYCVRKQPETETITADLIVVASGYRRDAHEEMLHGLREYMPGGEVEGKRWDVRRDYGVEFRHGSVARDAGVWLQGCNERTHGLSDSLLSILACRGGEIVESIFAGRVNR